MRWKILALLAGSAACANATQYPLTDADALMFGDIETITAFGEDTLPDLARRYSLGYEEIQRANPGVDVWLPGEGTTILIPGQRLLPPGPREGIVVNLPEHRLYYFPKPKKGEIPQVITFPVSIGKMDWNTPLGQTRIIEKRKNPTWTPPESVRREHAERGDPLPAVVKAGPDNPLGAYAMRLGISPGAYLIHGTNNPIAVGMAITHGCIRMYPEDIEALFPLVPMNTPVWLINEPVKVARVGGQVWLEVHPPIDAQGQRAEMDLENFYARANAALGETPAAIHWDFVLSTLKDASGLPQMIGLELDPELLPTPPEFPAEPVPAQSTEPLAPEVPAQPAAG
jgi:L,D-transpeptidase ErfK/SrfK